MTKPVIPGPARPLLRLGALAAATACAAAVALTVAGHGRAASADPALDLAENPGSCGAPPARLAAGAVSFQVTDDSRDFVDVYVIAAAGDRVYAEIQQLPPHRTLPLATDLGPGSYAVRCVFSDGKSGTSAPITVTGTADAAVPGYLPLPDLDLETPVREYSAWVQSRLPVLLAASRTLDRDVARGDLAAARADWLAAHLDYEQLGAAYNAFGDFDGEIDGMAGGLPLGTADPSWTGFFALEYALWHDGPAQRERSLADGLVSDVSGLIQDFPSEEVDPGDLALRTHEILENALQFQLTGIADYGSGTTLATVNANTQGTDELLSILTPLVRPRDPALLADARAGIASVQTDLRSANNSGSWTPVAALTTTARQRLDADLGALLETLDQVPNLLYPRPGA